VADDSPIDAYLATLPASQRDALQHLRSQILQLAPDAVETISYGSRPSSSEVARLSRSPAGRRIAASTR